MDDQGATELCHLMNCSKPLECVEASENQFFVDWSIFADCLKTLDTGLRSVSLGGSSCSIEMNERFFVALKSNTSLTSVTLLQLLVPTEQVCELFRENISLRFISFGDDAAFESVADFFKVIKTMEYNRTLVYFWAGKGFEEMQMLQFDYEHGSDYQDGGFSSHSEIGKHLLKLRQILQRNKTFDLLVRKEILLGYLFLRHKFPILDVNCFDLIITYADWKKKGGLSPQDQSTSGGEKSKLSLRNIPFLLESMT
eukprot:TRINITY_DN18358_c0_g1_i1.p1 TRINITY_DN18358_c0_g1~~TRINITY_DN18358_c0_g1_i1.p1  ORF type:complete len:292 (-),score=74.83 TRINITY_DN18358_c0_g1_i1:27-788(-)